VTVALDEPDVQRLGKAFRRATGLSPTDFRAAARAEVER
jgi:AraC-like DNA-binding protein